MKLKGYMADKLRPHIGHHIECAYYGCLKDPYDICLECVDCNEVLISAESFEEENNDD